ncbi:zinc finger protein 883-like [Daphnia carinata]|uniref:zinc finger protein 883-like n=1 Tax=Daphnia carinata TaxID=120202 RepID=UPI00257B1B72|nr:zinc finger protein 883-like [Daphnia carinata]
MFKQLEIAMMEDSVQSTRSMRQCPICSEVVGNKRQHIDMHYGIEFDHQCRYCDKIFAHPGNLRTHERVHLETVQDKSVVAAFTSEEEWPYKCKFCPKRFRFSSRLMEHTTIHSKERPYTCLYCPKTFKNAYSVWEHLANTHSTHNSTQVNKMNLPKAEIKSSLKTKAIHTMKVKGYPREIRYTLPASMKNANLCPRVVLSRSLTEVLNKM